MTEESKHVFTYGGIAIVAGIALIYFINKNGAASAASSAIQAQSTATATPNTPDFGAGFYGSATDDGLGLGEPVQNWGPGAATLPAPYVPPPPMNLPTRKPCGCCPADPTSIQSEIATNSALLLNYMYNGSNVGVYN